MTVWKNLIKDKTKLREYTKEFYDKHVAESTPDVRHVDAVGIEKLLPSLDKPLVASFESMGANYYEGDTDSEIYTESILHTVTYENDHPITQYLNGVFGNKFGMLIHNLQKPGQVVAPHVDNNLGFTRRCPFYFEPQNMTRAIIFLQDWKLGQSFTIGKTALCDWKKFQCFEFPWCVPHATANASSFDKIILSYTGI